MTKLALVLSLLANGLAGYLFFTRGSERTSAPTATQATANVSVDALARRMQEDLQKALAAHDERAQAEIRKRIAELETLRQKWTSMLEAEKSDAERSARYNTGKIEEIDQQVVTAWTNVEKQTQSLDSLAARVKALEERPVAVAGPAQPSGTPGAAPPKPVSPEPQAPPMPNQPVEAPEVVQEKTTKALADLDQADPAKLYPAINVVQKYKVLEAAPKLVKLLTPEPHPYVFTRQAAAAALGEILSCDAVPGLAEALLDKSMMVAQQANKSIRLITGFDTQMSPMAKKLERGKAKSDALEWWARHEDEVRARLKQPKAAK